MGDNSSPWDVPFSLAVRVMGRFHTIRAADGFRFTIDLADFRGASEFLIHRRTEAPLCRFYSRFIRSGDSVVDVGSNIGYFSILPAVLAGSTGRVLALEPTPSTAAVCRKNILQNNLESVITLRQCAASDVSGEAVLYINPKSSGNNSLLELGYQGASKQTVTVEVCVVDHLVKDWSSVALVKVDVEGHELNVINGMRETFAKNSAAVVICEVAPRWLRAAGTQPEELFEAFRRDSRSVYSVRSDGRLEKIIDSRSYVAQLDKADTGGNVALVRDSAIDGLVSAGRISLVGAL